MTDYRNAPCQHKTSLFFPEDEAAPGVWDAPRAICTSCPLKQRCLHENGDLPFGMVGGLTPAERHVGRLG